MNEVSPIVFSSSAAAKRHGRAGLLCPPAVQISVPVAGRPGKILHQIAICFFQGRRATEVGGVCLNESGIEIVLADQQTELIP